MNHIRNIQNIFDKFLSKETRPFSQQGVGAKLGKGSRLQIKKVVVGASITDVTQTNPTDGGTLVNLGYPIWEVSGPVITDINQNQLSDCYFLAALASLANNSAGRAHLKTRLIPDPKVQNGVITIYTRNGIETHIHSDILVATFANSSPGDLWPEIFEKTYALFRSGMNTYSSLNFGNSSAVAADLGCTPSGINYLGQNQFASIAAGLKNNSILAVDTASSGTILPNLVQNHCYTITGIDAQNNVTLYNPWGVLAPDQHRVVAPADLAPPNFNYLEFGSVPTVVIDPTIALQAEIDRLKLTIKNATEALQ